MPAHKEGFVLREWSVEDGLPHNVVNSVIRDKRGYLWVGGLGGLARFDGLQFVEYRVPEEYMAGGYSYNIRALAVEDNNTLVMITDGNKLVRLRDGVFELHPANALVSDVQLRDLAVDATGALWVGSTAPSIMRWDGKTMQTFGPEDGVASRGGRFCVVSTKDGRVWVGADDYLGVYDSGELRPYRGEVGHSFLLAPTRDGGVWIAAVEHLAKLENGKLTIVLSGEEWPAARYGMRDLFDAKDGSLWIATRRDIMFRLADGKLERIPLRIDRVLSLTDDIDGNVWLGTYGGGLVRATLKHDLLLNTASGMPTEVSSSVCEDSTGALWCANQAGGLVRVKGREIDVAVSPDGQVPYMSNVCADRQGRIWASTSGGLLWTTVDGEPVADSDRRRWTLQRYDRPMRNVQTLFCAKNGDLWISWNYDHLSVMRNGVMRDYTKEDGFPGGRVAGVTEREGGEIWVCLEQGRLFRLTEVNKFEEAVFPEEIRSPRLFSLYVDSANRLWIGTTNGLLLWRGAQSRLFTRADGLPDRLINQIIEDEHERLWMSSRRGIFFVSIKQLLDVADAPSDSGAKVTATLLGRDENLDGISGMSGGQPMVWRSHDDRIWFVSYRGVIGLDTPEPSSVRQSLPVYIDGIKANGGPMETVFQGKTVHIASGAAPIEICFSALNFSTPERTRVRRMLEGIDVDWIDAGNERNCTYPRLPPGRYTFRVQAADADSGIMKSSEASVQIVIEAAWWQTWTARVGAVLLFSVIIIWCAFRVSHRLLKQRLRRLEREHALERERSRIARDLHDDLGGRMTKVGFVADRLQRQNSDPAQNELLGRLVLLAANLVEDLHRIIWTVNPENDCWQQLASYIARYAQRHLADTGIVCMVEGVESIPSMPLTPEVQHHLLALTKEALNNLLKHSKADRVVLYLSAADGRFRMSITDNGRGFDVADPKNGRGNGLSNMQVRMAEIDGQIAIVSRVGEGTQITVDVPMEYKPPSIHHVTSTRQQCHHHAHHNRNR